MNSNKTVSSSSKEFAVHLFDLGLVSANYVDKVKLELKKFAKEHRKIGAISARCVMDKAVREAFENGETECSN